MCKEKTASSVCVCLSAEFQMKSSLALSCHSEQNAQLISALFVFMWKTQTAVIHHRERRKRLAQESAYTIYRVHFSQTLTKPPLLAES